LDLLIPGERPRTSNSALNVTTTNPCGSSKIGVAMP